MFSQEQSVAHGGEDLAVCGKLILHFRQHAIAADEKWPGTPFHTGIDVGDSEIALLHLRCRLTPRRNVGIGREIRLWLGAALNSVVGEGRVPPILGVASRHVTADAIAVLAGMRSREISRVAGEAFGAVELHWIKRLVVGIMAGPAPQLTVAHPSANAPRQLLNMADDLELAGVATGRQGIDVGGENVFRRLSRPKVAKRLSRIQHFANAQQMTLFTDAVASGRIKLRGINYRAGPGIAEVFFLRTVTAFASDRLRRERGGPILVRCVGNGQGRSGMAEQTSLGDGPREVRIRSPLVAGRQVVSLAALVVSHRGLEQMTRHVEQVPGGVIAGADHVINAIAGGVSATLQALPIAGWR